jgi:hypothetical protein
MIARRFAVSVATVVQQLAREAYDNALSSR